jgi:uncharacterized protein YktB (UPF0637 family)
MAFNGFTQREFEIFHLPGFETRMPAIRAEVTPKLKALGEQLLTSLRQASRVEFHPHVAQHMRRTVNPPVETWAAFSPSTRAYKPFTHFRVAINGEGIKIVCHVEEDSDDKATFAAGLKRNSAALAACLAAHPEIQTGVPRGELGSGAPPPDAAALAALGERLERVKAQDATFCIALARTDPVVGSTALLERALAAMQTLLPVYRLGTEPGFVVDAAR